MAKEQNISLNPSKISGNCWKINVLSKIWKEVYEDKLKRLPNVGAIVKTEDGEGEVDGVETLKERVKVKFKTEDGDGYTYKRYDAKDIKVIKRYCKRTYRWRRVEKIKRIRRTRKIRKKKMKKIQKIYKIKHYKY